MLEDSEYELMGVVALRDKGKIRTDLQRNLLTSFAKHALIALKQLDFSAVAEEAVVMLS